MRQINDNSLSPRRMNVTHTNRNHQTGRTQIIRYPRNSSLESTETCEYSDDAYNLCTYFYKYHYSQKFHTRRKVRISFLTVSREYHFYKCKLILFFPITGFFSLWKIKVVNKNNNSQTQFSVFTTVITILSSFIFGSLRGDTTRHCEGPLGGIGTNDCRSTLYLSHFIGLDTNLVILI